jgi:hypothetical protein
MSGDKSVALFGNTFGRNHDSEEERGDASQAANAAANPAPSTGAQFEFSAEQVARDRERAEQLSESEGWSMLTAGKTTESTRLNLKVAWEEPADIRMQLLQPTPAKTTTPNATMSEASKEHSEMADTSDAGIVLTKDDNQDHIQWHEPVYEVPTSYNAKMDNSDMEQPTDNAPLQPAAAAAASS